MYSIVDLQEKRKKHPFVLGSIIALLVLCIGSIVGLLIVDTKEEVVTEIEAPPQKYVINTFKDLDLIAKGIVVWDVKNNTTLFERSAHEPRPLASISKVMTALVAHELLSDERIVIRDSDLLAEGDSGLIISEVWKARDLVDFTLVVSSNDGARALASALESLPKEESPIRGTHLTFVDYMNSRARSLGLHDTVFRNPSGLDAWDLSESGAYGSPVDVARLVDYIIENKPEVLEATRYDHLAFNSESNFYHIAHNTNEIVNDIPFLIGGKTGYTDLAGGNLMIAFDVGIDRPIIIAVLGSTREGRFTDMKKLYKATMEYINVN